jgi:hypothetical protein
MEQDQYECMTVHGRGYLVLKHGRQLEWVADDGSNEEMNAKKIGWHTGQALFRKKMNIIISHVHIYHTREKPSYEDQTQSQVRRHAPEHYMLYWRT